MKKQRDNGCEIEFRAAASAYFVLAGIWIVLSIFWICIWFVKGNESNAHEAVIICFSVALIWIIWLRGFRLIVTDQKVMYRNGLYQWRKCKTSNIVSFKMARIDWKVLMRHISVPRLLIKVKNEGPILINIKPFKRADLKKFQRILESRLEG